MEEQDGHHEEEEIYQDYCFYDYTMYPTTEFHDSFQTSIPVLTTIGVIMIFFIDYSRIENAADTSGLSL